MQILLFIGVLFVLVLVHEWGHYFVAKLSKMRVDEFGIGFPPRLFGWKKGETLYSFNLIPLGGFVKIHGEDASEEPSEDSGRAFSSRPLYMQALVLIAGVTMNILFAWLLFTVAFALGTQSGVAEENASDQARLVVVSVMPGSPAEEAGVQSGDVIVSVAADTNEMPAKLVPSSVSPFIQSHDRVALAYERNDEMFNVTVDTEKGIAQDDPEKKIIGITMGLVEEVRKPIHVAAYDAGVYTVQSIGAIAVGLGALLYDAVRFEADFSSVAGPVGIAGLVGDAASFGLTSLLVFTAFISLNLAVINLLPFPALDGGRLLFVAIEAVKGSPVPPKFAQVMNGVGFILLITLMLFVTFNDIAKII
ncbi:RIP metalloprotease RseP [Patescibacteria group bacterium]|nr:RIP metalloprotease RseP [Patescibacteria group bacterium]